MDDVLATATTYRSARAHARAERRERALARIPEGRRVARARVDDPIARSRSERGPAPLWLAASLVAHVGVGVLGLLVPAPALRASGAFEQAVEVIEPPKPAPVDTAPPVPPPDKPVPTMEPVAARPTKTVVETPSPVTPKDEPPPDPTDPPATSPDPAPTRPARRVVGLNLESTVPGGGPSFGVGNTRMGESSRIAADPGGVAGQSGAQLVPPRRTREVPPDYPPALRAQSIEGDVVLKVDVDATGHVSGVTIVSASPHLAFNDAAVVAAKSSAYAPAMVNGAPVANTIQFTVRFRLKH